MCSHNDRQIRPAAAPRGRCANRYGPGQRPANLSHGCPDPAAPDGAQSAEWISKHPDRRERDAAHIFAIEQDGDLIGIVGAERDQTHVPFEIGYWLAPAFWGKGLMTEAAGSLIQWLRERGERAFVSGYLVDNPASGRVLDKLQFMKADRSSIFCMGRGERVDHFNMARVG